LIFPGIVQQSRDHERQLLPGLSPDFPAVRSDEIAGSGDQSSQYSLVDRGKVLVKASGTQYQSRINAFAYQTAVRKIAKLSW